MSPVPKSCRLLAGTVAAVVACTIPSLGADDPAATTVVVAEGVGKDAKEARGAAFRDAVSRVVGTLVDADTLVKNDRVIRERVLEFSGGFVKTYDTLDTEVLPNGLVRVRIQATVERLRVIERLEDAKVTVTGVRGADLLAERMTKEEARKNATALLAKLYEDLPKLAVAAVKGQPRLTPDRTGLIVDVDVSVDPKAYAKFVDRAAVLLDKIAVRQSRHLFAGHVGKTFLYLGTEDVSAGLFLPPGVAPAGPKWSPANVFGKDVLIARRATVRDDPGYGVWLLTGADSRFEKTRWVHSWVDADYPMSTTDLGGEPVLVLALVDARGKPIAEAERSATELRGVDGFGRIIRLPGPWFLCDRYWADPKQNLAAFHPRPRDRFTPFPFDRSLTIAPFACWAALLNGETALGYTPSVRISTVFKLADGDLEQVAASTAKVEFRK